MKEDDDILVLTPYIVCNDKMHEGLLDVNESKENFAIVTNAPETGANIVCCVCLFIRSGGFFKRLIKCFK